MTSEANSLYMSRLAGLVLTAADLAFEIDHKGDIVFAVDGVFDDAATSRLVGRNWKSLICSEDHAKVVSVLAGLDQSRRDGPYQVRRLNADGDAQPTLLSVFMSPHLAPNISIVLSPPPIRHGETTSDQTLLDAVEFARRLPEVVERHRHKGLGIELAMIELSGLTDAFMGGAGDGEGVLLSGITDLLRSRSVTGEMVAEISPERFLVLGPKKAHDDLEGVLVRALADAHVDLKPKTVCVAVPRRLELPYALRALRLTIEKFTLLGICGGGEDLLSAFNGSLAQTFDSAKSFMSMTSSRSFDLVYQPVVSLLNKDVHHYEVLSRFPNGSDPFSMIQMAEELEIIVEFDLAVMQKAFDEMRLREHVPNLAINISARSFLQAGFLDRVLRLVNAESRLKGRIMFEITESVALSDLALANAYIQRLRTAGYPVCLDDFGSGATSFSYLQALAVDTVKIDGQYIKRLKEGNRDQILVRHLGMLCKELKISTIAEMVETKATLDALNSCNISLVQGYFLGRPGPLPLDKRGLVSRRLGAKESWQ